MEERTSDWTKFTLQSFIESPDVVVVGMFLDFLCLCHPPAIAHLAQMVLDLGTNPNPSLIMNSGFGLLKVGLVGRVFLMHCWPCDHTHGITWYRGLIYCRGGEPIYYHGPYKLWIIAVGPQITTLYPKILPLSYYEDGGVLLHRTWLSWSFVLTWFSTLNWVTKILMRAISNVHASRRFSIPDLLNFASREQKRTKKRRSHYLTISANLTKTILFNRKFFLKNSPKTACTLIKLAQITATRNSKKFPATKRKKQPNDAGKPSNWQHWWAG